MAAERRKNCNGNGNVNGSITDGTDLRVKHHG